MKIKVGELVKIQKALSKVASATFLKPKTVYGAAKAIRQISQQFEIYNKERMKWFRELGEVIQIQNPKNPSEMINHPKGERRIKPENVEEFETRRDEFENFEVEIYDFQIFLSDIVKYNDDTKEERGKFTIDEISNLLPWIIDDTSNEKQNVPLEPVPTC